MLGASRSNFAWPNTTRLSMVSLTTAGLHRSPVDVAVPGPFAVIRASSVGTVELRQEQQESGRSDDVRGVHTKLSLLYVTLRLYHGTLAAKKKAVHAPINRASEARGKGDKRSTGGRVRHIR